VDKSSDGCGQPFGFTDRWFELGLVSDELLDRSLAEWSRGEGCNPEHYRYGAFKEYLAAHRPLGTEICTALFELGAADPDIFMGGAIMADIVRLPECPRTVLDAAKASGLKHLIRIVEQRSRP
jgi:hypothetical protein